MNGRLRVLMLTTQLGYGGSESNFVELAKYLSNTCDVTVAIFTRDYGRGDYALAVPDVPLPLVILDPGAPGGRISRWRQRMQSLRELKDAHDVTVSFLSGPNLLNVLCAGPSIISERGSKRHHVGMGFWSKFLWTRIVDPFVYSRAERVVAVSTGYATEVKALAWTRHAGKVVAIEGGLDAHRLVARGDKPIEDSVTALADLDTIVFCGRLDRGKGIDFLVRLFPQIKAEVPRAKLLIIGDGPLLPELRQMLHANRITSTTEEARLGESDVFFAGYRPEPVRYFRVGKVFAFPSQHEGLPNVLIEAVASGVNILAADCPYGPRSILAVDATSNVPVTQPSGTLMPEITARNSEHDWCTALVQALRRPVPRRSAQERHAAIERFDFSVAGKLWLDLIDEIARPTSRAAQDTIQQATP